MLWNNHAWEKKKDGLFVRRVMSRINYSSPAGAACNLSAVMTMRVPVK